MGLSLRIGSLALDGEMVVLLTRAEVGRGLRDQLRPPEVRVPCRGLVDGELEAVGLALDARVGVRGRDVEVGGDGRGAVDVVLVLSDLQFKAVRDQSIPSPMRQSGNELGCPMTSC